MSDKQIMFFKGSLSTIKNTLKDKYRALINVNENIDSFMSNNNMMYGIEQNGSIKKYVIPNAKYYDGSQWIYCNEKFGFKQARVSETMLWYTWSPGQ